jgi:hypothetical protein
MTNRGDQLRDRPVIVPKIRNTSGKWASEAGEDRYHSWLLEPEEKGKLGSDTLSHGINITAYF